jgi:hypothetical protein
VILKPTTLINDYITVEYFNSTNEAYMGTNLIGVNMYAPPAGIHENSKQPPLKIWPNPAQDILYIQLPDEQTEISICSMEGKEVMRLQLVKGKNQIDISSLSNGMYILKSGNTFARFVVAR